MYIIIDIIIYYFAFKLLIPPLFYYNYDFINAGSHNNTKPLQRAMCGLVVNYVQE